MLSSESLLETSAMPSGLTSTGGGANSMATPVWLSSSDEDGYRGATRTRHLLAFRGVFCSTDGGHTCNSAWFMTLVLPFPSAGSTTYVPFSNWSTTLCTLVLHRSWILFLRHMVQSLTSTRYPISTVDRFTLLCLSYFCLRIAASFANFSAAHLCVLLSSFWCLETQVIGSWPCVSSNWINRSISSQESRPNIK